MIVQFKGSYCFDDRTKPYYDFDERVVLGYEPAPIHFIGILKTLVVSKHVNLEDLMNVLVLKYQKEEAWLGDLCLTDVYGNILYEY